jgi:hypothetical protein
MYDNEHMFHLWEIHVHTLAAQIEGMQPVDTRLKTTGNTAYLSCSGIATYILYLNEQFVIYRNNLAVEFIVWLLDPPVQAKDKYFSSVRKWLIL